MRKWAFLSQLYNLSFCLLGQLNLLDFPHFPRREIEQGLGYQKITVMIVKGISSNYEVSILQIKKVLTIEVIGTIYFNSSTSPDLPFAL